MVVHSCDDLHRLGGWSGTKATAHRVDRCAHGTTSFTLSCIGDGGSANQTATVTVTTPPPPLPRHAHGEPDSVASAGLDLTWNSTNATGCTLGRLEWHQGHQRQPVHRPVDGDDELHAELHRHGWQRQSDDTVTVTSRRRRSDVTLTANPINVASGGSSTSPGVRPTRRAAPPRRWSGAKATSGSQSTGALTATTSYTLSCTGTAAAPASRSAYRSRRRRPRSPLPRARPASPVVDRPR